MKHIRYTVRKEYFGGLMYDKYADAYIPINKEFYETLKKIRDLQDDTFLLDKHRALLLREGILTPSGISYRIVEQKTIGSNLSAPVRIHFCYTNECNMNCKHCFTKLQNLKLRFMIAYACLPEEGAPLYTGLNYNFYKDP